MLPWDPTGKIGPKRPLPDHVSIVEPKEETLPPNPFSETKAASEAGGRTGEAGGKCSPGVGEGDG